jgi:type III secretion protein D
MVTAGAIPSITIEEVSFMSKEIRILTGFHAGAQIELSTTTMSIGAKPDADILINDWSECTMQLAIDAQDNLTIAVPGEAGIAMDDFMPRRFGEVVLCAGPANTRWPSDLQLMESMLAAQPEGRKYDGETSDGVFPAGPPSTPIVMRSRRSPWVHAGVAALLIGSMGAAAVVLPAGKTTLAADRPQARATLADVQQALAQLHQPDLAVARQGDGFLVTGIAANAAEARRTRAALQALAGNRLNWSVRSGDEIAGSLAESLHEANLHVSYAGAGRLEVTGSARHPGEVREVVERFRSDMQPLVARIDVEVTSTDDLKVAGDIDSALSADGVKYVESSDGTKNFVAELPSNTTLH